MFGRKKVDYFEGTYYEGDSGGPYGLDLFKRQTKRIFRTIVDFDKDYLGQRRVELWPLHFEDKKPPLSNAQALTTWTQWLDSHTSKIRDLTVYIADQELLEAIAKQPQIERLTITDGNFTDLSPLTLLPKLTYLQIHPRSADIDFSVLKKVKSLRALHIHSRKVLRFETLSGLSQLDGLWIGSGIDPAFDGKSIKVPNLDFLRPLTQLKRLRIDSVRPVDRDFSPLLDLKNLEQAWYIYFRGQHPSVEEMAKAHPAFVGVYENKLYIDETYSGR